LIFLKVFLPLVLSMCFFAVNRCCFAGAKVRTLFYLIAMFYDVFLFYFLFKWLMAYFKGISCKSFLLFYIFLKVI